MIAWGVSNAALILNAFLGGRNALAWYDLFLVFFVSAFAAFLLVDAKTLILGTFESLFLSVLLVYIGMILPVLLGDVAGFYQANIVYWEALGFIFRAFFPIGAMTHILGGLFGWFAEGLLT